ncbi:uncharacterized protein K02A2.6-like [Mizuhopecten yessoensis]|uniref:uncharacterized protein K02A2.6-like n=1 Tax=Mizuhopecten yessoensis TaxID=6573 RepID=UPI000B45A0BB|nr:uncharacterized protein K02A2.6-like [Mizuhopecten yessoensis]
MPTCCDISGSESVFTGQECTATWKNIVSECDTCNTHSSDQRKEPLIHHEVCQRPWQKVGIDIFTLNQKDFLLTVYYFSSFFEVDRLHDKTAKEIVGKVRSRFARHGIPDTVVTDNGPPFCSNDFAAFAHCYEFENITSSPLYPQSNGKVENAVKVAKRLMIKSIADEKDPYLALLNWRNTPSEGLGSSPAQRLYSRRTKTLLPMPAHLLESQVQQNVTKLLTERKAKQAYYYNTGSKELERLKTGDTVRVRPHGRTQQWQKAVVRDQVDIRSYKIRTEDGREYRRNRWQLRKTVSSRHIPLLADMDHPSEPPRVTEPSPPRVSRIPFEPPSPPQVSRIPVRDRPSKSETPTGIPSDPASGMTPDPMTPQKTRSGRVVKLPERFTL